MHFLLPAAYSPIKGQDILLQAVAKLPKHYADRSLFTLCGYYKCDDGSEDEYYSVIRQFGDKLNNVQVLGEVSRDSVFQMIQDSQCIVVPSRLDSVAMTAVEAMMFKKLVLVSTGAGISSYMQDCVNGFVFPNEDVNELYKRLLLIIEDVSTLGGIAEEGRKVYEKNFSPEAVLRRLLSIIA